MRLDGAAWRPPRAAPAPRSTGAPRSGSPGFWQLAGVRYGSASLLPALVGTTLPYWLRPPGFAFRWLPAIEFLLATLFFHVGFSFLQARFAPRSSARWTPDRLLCVAAACLIAGCLLGLHLNHGLTLHRGVPGSIFIIYGLGVLLLGTLYVAPPFRFNCRLGGETILAVGLGLMPVLGAYLVQVGDLTRTVYLASLPPVVATALWVGLDELVTRAHDEREGRRTLVVLFGSRLSGRFGVPALWVLLYATLLLAVARGALSPGALLAVVPFGLGVLILPTTWKEHAGTRGLLTARRYAALLHLATCAIIAAVSWLMQGS